eukprot:gene3430-3923_t
MSCDDDLSTVVFVKTLDVYPPRQSITCQFAFKGGEAQCFEEGCWIGIFKVGWESSDDALAKKCLPTQIEEEFGAVLFSTSNEEVMFDAGEIPGENDEEFYQFCFITGTGLVLGASCPFQITQIASHEGNISNSFLDLSANVTVDQKNNVSQDLEWCPWDEVSGEDVDDAVFVHSKTTLLEKSLAKVIEENNDLRETIEVKENEIQNMNSELIEFQNQMSATKDILNDKRKQQECDIEQLEELQLAVEAANANEENMRIQLVEANKAKGDLSRRLEESKEEVVELIKQLNKKEDSLKEVCAEFERKFEASECAITDLKEALCSEKKNIECIRSEYQEEMKKLMWSFDSVLSELASQKECNDKHCLENQALKDRLEQTHTSRDEELNDLTDMLDRKEATVRELERQLAALRFERQKLVQEFETKLNEAEKKVVSQKNETTRAQAELAAKVLASKDREALLNEELQASREDAAKKQALVKALEDTLHEMKEEAYLLKEKSNGHSGARHALQVAYKHTQRQLAQVKGDRDILVQQCQSLKQQSMDPEENSEVGELKKKVEDLKLRLCFGANAYREKFVECKKLQSAIRRLVEKKAKASAVVNNSHEEDDSCSQESCESRPFIQSKTNTKEASANSGDGKVTQVKRKTEVDCERSLPRLSEEVKKLQDENKEKDAMLQKSNDELKRAKEEIELLKAQLTKFQNPEGKFTRFYEQFYSAEEEPSSAARTQVQASSAKDVKANKERPSSAHPNNPATLLELVTAKRCSATTTPLQVASGVVDEQAVRSKKKDAKQYQIFYPPSTLAPRDNCLSSAYTKTLREPVALQRPYSNDGSYYYDEETSKLETTASDVLKSDRVVTCPVCEMKFPSDYSDVAATAHVNSHFQDVSAQASR